MASKEIAAPDYGVAKAFFSEHGAVDQGGATTTVTRGQFYDFHKSQGNDRAVVDQVFAVADQMTGGAIQLATDQLEKRIAAAKAAGDDPASLTQEVRIATPTGRTIIEVAAERKSRNPLTGDEVVKHGGVRVTTKFSKANIPTGPSESARSRITAAMDS